MCEGQQGPQSLKCTCHRILGDIFFIALCCFSAHFLHGIVVKSPFSFKQSFYQVTCSPVVYVQFILVFSLYFQTFSAHSEELVSFNGISASVSSDYKCSSEANVRLDTDEEERYRKSRVDMQKLSRIVKTYLWLDCKEMESIYFDGYVEGNDESSYRASIEKKNDWFLQEQLENETEGNDQKAVEENTQYSLLTEPAQEKRLSGKTEPVKNQPESEKNSSLSKPTKEDSFATLESLEAAAISSPEAKLELAKGLLDLPDKIEGIDFPDDADRGIEILEKLAAEGNPDAMQLLSQAYSSNKKIDLNIPLIEALTGRPMVDGDDQRGTASAMMTLDAAAKGSELAVDALQDAGQAGSQASYYALGMMYLLDKALKMPYDQEFLEQELEIESDVSGSGGNGNVDVGLHFLKLAAEDGNSDAQELLTDMEVEFEMPEPSNGSSNATSSSLLASQTTEDEDQGQASSASNNSSVNAIAHTEALMEEGALNDVLERRSTEEAANAESNTTKLGSASSQTQDIQRTGAGNENIPSTHQAGASNNTGKSATARASSRRQQSTQQRSHTKYGNMNTKQNEAEIID